MMPTAGWILETAEERFLDGIRGADADVPFFVSCPLCDERFTDRLAWQQHLGFSHPIDIPQLIISGRRAGREFIVRQPLQPDDIVLHSCTGCAIATSGHTKTISPKELGRWLCEKRPQTVDIRMLNDRALDTRSAAVDCRVEFRIAPPDLLADCDRLFASMLAVPSPTMSDIDGYRRSIPDDPAVVEYGGALADYVVGVLLKEQSGRAGVRGPLEAFRDKFMGALEMLDSFPRRLSRAIVTAIEFNLNAWQRIAPPRQMPSFVRAADFFRNPPVAHAALAASGTDAVEHPICPLDLVTDRILCVIGRILDPGAGRRVDHVRALEALHPGVPLGEYDRLKVDVIGAVAGLLDEEWSFAQPYLRAIQFNERFGPWAKTQLEEISQYG